ncbi:MAG: hypothetical protein PHU78_01320, partial [Heliobacteriaceae bacterium]|nr:hypothetical protein [Heliobacteriaceae bacterium]
MDLLVLHPRRASARRLAKALDCQAATVYPEVQPDLLVRFGHREGPEGRVLTINPREALGKLPRPALARLFRLHRLPYGAGNAGTREVIVHIVDARVVGLRTKDPFTIAEKQKALGTAIRALYLIGLDFGVVKVKVPSHGNPRVAWVRTAPVLSSLLAKGYAREINALIGRFLTTPAPPARADLNIADDNDILLGADPEFMLKSTKGRLVPAYTFFSQKGMVGCDQLRAIGELRPAPRTSPQALTESIRNLLIRASNRIRRKSIRIVAGSWPFKRFPIGGHIHFGRLPLTFQLIRALDNYLLIPLFLVENKATSLKRRRHYGCLGDV